MSSLSVTTQCSAAESADGRDHCGTALAPLFFIPFIMISSYVMVNLFCAIILDNFSTTMELDQSDLKVADLKKFAEAWAHFDPDATMLTKTKNFPNLLAALKPPLGIERKTDRHKLLRIAREYVIPEHEGEIHFVETLIPLARKTLGVEFTDEEIRDHEEQWRKHFPDLNQLRVIRYRQKRVTVDQYFAATYIAGAFRRRLARRVVALMRRDKRDDLLTWYEDHDVPESQMYAVHRMDVEERGRFLQLQANQRQIQEVVLRQQRESQAGFDDDEDRETGNTAPWQDGVAAFVGDLAEEADDKIPGRGAASSSPQPLPRRPSQVARRESFTGKQNMRRRQSVGLTGFTHLWAAHAAEL